MTQNHSLEPCLRGEYCSLKTDDDDFCDPDGSVNYHPCCPHVQIISVEITPAGPPNVEIYCSRFGVPPH